MAFGAQEIPKRATLFRMPPSILESVVTGAYGVRLAVPPALAVERDSPQMAQLADATTGVRYMILTKPRGFFVLDGDRAELARSLDRHARQMFIDAHRANQIPDPPRTDDATWSAMIELEHCIVAGHAALRTVHRMIYTRGLEMVMGHLLFPTAHGLFEVRVMAMDRQTGWRESAVLVASGAKGLLTQAEYDAPERDAQFPQHALSRVRAALRTIRADWAIAITAPPPATVTASVALPHLACTLTAPPRFVHDPAQDGDGVAAFGRVSFCATDGLESLYVERHRAVAANDLARFADEYMRSALGNVANLTIAIETPMPGVLTQVIEGMGNRGPLRNVVRWFYDGKNRLVSLTIVSSHAEPSAELLQQLAAVQQSFTAA